ncbi:hypothetical protein MNEG_4419 [Monoraphidium neglectum]|uniref:Uncharacterized protein n=1 Tax=Monoraphidium neglectum TaxID=145388 RepID=A0A0D2MSX6_9CHLO|nr:hypothetical protein MNEG_4419 [Monoraphidium neglectum]KIZ03537.1 hypothetical protein MNEG_4419 [Monoraphidium neglectum]|eukprot:XP_013902556.1 hypothetical protein MNEG_4419 [Monoraphidium neglectum]
MARGRGALQAAPLPAAAPASGTAEDPLGAAAHSRPQQPGQAVRRLAAPPRPQSLEADVPHVQHLQERSQRAVAQGGGAPAWVEPWVAPPRVQQPDQQQQQQQPRRQPAAAARTALAGGKRRLEAETAAGLPGAIDAPRKLQAVVAAAAGRVAGGRGWQAAPAAPATAAVVGRPHGGSRGGSEAAAGPRSPAAASAHGHSQLEADDTQHTAAPTPTISRRSWPGANPLSGLLGAAQGLLAPPPGPAAPVAPQVDAPPPSRRLPPTRALSAAPPAPAAAHRPHDGLSAVRFVVLPHLAPADTQHPANPLAAVAAGAMALLRSLSGQQQQLLLQQPIGGGGGARAQLRGVDALVVAVDTDAALLGDGAAAAPVARAALGSGLPAVALLLRAATGAPQQVWEEAQVRLSELLGGTMPVAPLDVNGIMDNEAGAADLAAGHPRASPVAARWEPALAALPSGRRAALRGQVAAARAALQTALTRGDADWAIPLQRSKL